MKGPLSQQTRPNFSGRWMLVPEAGEPPAADAMTVTHDRDYLVIEQLGGASVKVPIKIVYRLDGTEMKQVINRTEVVTTARWDGGKLVTTVTGPSADWQDVWSLEGDRLVIVTTTPGRTWTSTRRYRKNGPPGVL